MNGNGGRVVASPAYQQYPKTVRRSRFVVLSFAIRSANEAENGPPRPSMRKAGCGGNVRKGPRGARVLPHAVTSSTGWRRRGGRVADGAVDDVSKEVSERVARLAGVSGVGDLTAHTLAGERRSSGRRE